MSRELKFDEQEEIRIESNSSLLSTSTNDDVKELCLLLDEERYQMHQLAEQWKYFGKNTINKLESQIVDYQKKLNDLERRQLSLLKENESLKSLFNQIITPTVNNNTQLINKKSQQNASTQTDIDKQDLFIDNSVDDSLQQQVLLQNMLDAIKIAEIYESIETITEDDAPEKVILKQFCNLIWKYLEEHSKPKSSCLL